MRMVRFTSMVAAAVLAAGMTACGSAEKSQNGAEDPPARASSSGSVATLLNATKKAAGENAKPVVVAGKLPEIDSRDTSYGSTPVRITLNSVTVSGGLTTVVFTAKNNNSADSDKKWQVADSFFNGEYKIPIDDKGGVVKANTGHAADGVTILDGKNQILYRVAYDSTGKCLCSGNLSATFVAPQLSYTFQATYAGLPKDVDKVSVTIPGAGSFENVPVTR